MHYRDITWHYGFDTDYYFIGADFFVIAILARLHGGPNYAA